VFVVVDRIYPSLIFASKVI